MGNAIRPIYLLAGGGSWRARKTADPLIARILSQAGKERPSIAYIGVASDDNRGFLWWIKGFLRQAGAGEVRLAPLASPRADLAEAQAILADSDLVFVSGGDVEAGMKRLEQRGIIPFLNRLHRAGKPFFGVSAGSIILARCWVRWADPRDDATSERFPCLGLAPILCDTHAESADWEELKALLMLVEPTVGYGIPSGAALRVDSDGTVAALGKPAPRFKQVKGKIVSLPPLPPS